jgi:catechol 2,3-dioxygenase-like lactoylglutathione lyase family enzyme
MSTRSTHFHTTAPIFRVVNLTASIRYYVDLLGFSIDWEYKGLIASVSRDGCGIFLCEGDQGHPGAWSWIGVGDVDRLHEELRGKGARIRHPPTNYSWALEMQVEDLDGNVLRLGSDPKEGEPFGEWLDMHGRRWVEGPEGGPICLDP